MNALSPATAAPVPKSLSPIAYPILSAIPNVVHGVFDRHGGVSRPPHDSLNVAWTNGDQQEAVGENLRRVKKWLGFDELSAAPQIHGDTIHILDEHSLPPVDSDLPVRITSPADALVTCLRGVGLLIKVADCQAVFLVNPVRQVVANVHCGWRGSVEGILGKVVALLEKRFQSRPEDLVAAISPSLGPCCAEFRNYRRELPPSFLPFKIGDNHFDFWAISRWQLEQAGLRPEHIQGPTHCTVCGADRFFSYRAAAVTGRMAAVVGWQRS
jgi:polyphenol oxidase